MPTTLSQRHMHSDWSFPPGEPSTQVVMSTQPAASDTNGTDTLVIPGCVAILSVFLLLSRQVSSSKTVEKLLALAGFSFARKSEIAAPGIGKFTQIFMYRLARLLGCLALFGLSFASFIRNGDIGTKWTRRQGIDATMSLTYVCPDSYNLKPP